jgi:hypothetical protein
MVLDAISQLRVSPLGFGDLTTDAWGSQKVSLPHSLVHGLFTFDVPQTQWFMFHGATQVYSSSNIVSVDGTGIVTANAANPVARLESRVTPRYQPNRGHLFSTAFWMPNKLNDGERDVGLITVENGVFFRLKSDGLLYACLKSNGILTREELIDTSGIVDFDVEKGNIYDIQYQWRGVGNYSFYINLTKVHVFSMLGTLTALSMADPALPICSRPHALPKMSLSILDALILRVRTGRMIACSTGSVYAAATLNGTSLPLVVVHNPLTTNGKTNTRMLELARISINSDKKGLMRVWITRDPTAFTGMTLASVNYGSNVYSDSPDSAVGAVRATAVDLAKLRLITSVPVQANVTSSVDNPSAARIDFPLARGDYLVITVTMNTALCDAVIEYGEAI